MLCGHTYHDYCIHSYCSAKGCTERELPCAICRMTAAMCEALDVGPPSGDGGEISEDSVAEDDHDQEEEEEEEEVVVASLPKAKAKAVAAILAGSGPPPEDEEEEEVLDASLPKAKAKAKAAVLAGSGQPPKAKAKAKAADMAGSGPPAKSKAKAKSTGLAGSGPPAKSKATAKSTVVAGSGPPAKSTVLAGSGPPATVALVVDDTEGKGQGKGDIEGKGQGKASGKGDIDGTGGIESKGQGKGDIEGMGQGKASGKGGIEGTGGIQGKGHGKGDVEGTRGIEGKGHGKDGGNPLFSEYVRCFSCNRFEHFQRCRLVSKTHGRSWRCSGCHVKTTQLYRRFGSWPTAEFEALDEHTRQSFMASLQGLDGPTAVAKAAELLESYRVDEEIFQDGGEFLPLSVWAQKGFDTSRIEEFTPDPDKKWHHVCGRFMQ